MLVNSTLPVKVCNIKLNKTNNLIYVYRLRPWFLLLAIIIGDTLNYPTSLAHQFKFKKNKHDKQVTGYLQMYWNEWHCIYGESGSSD